MFDHSQKDKSLYIQKRYPITNQEFEVLEEKYGKLCWYAATNLAFTNGKSEEDRQYFHSEILIGIFRAGSYYKRQTFIENVFEYLDKYKDEMESSDIFNLEKLKDTWKHKANFTETHEIIIREILKKYENISKEECPKDNFSLIFDDKFEIYCKAIIWNTKKSLGQAISKDNENRRKEVSFDDCQFLEHENITDAIQKQRYYETTNYIQDDFKSIRNELSKLKDNRSLTTFDILVDSANHDFVFKKNKEKKQNIKINIVRRKTKMSYAIINQQLKIIKKIIKKEMEI